MAPAAAAPAPSSREGRSAESRAPSASPPAPAPKPAPAPRPRLRHERAATAAPAAAPAPASTCCRRGGSSIGEKLRSSPLVRRLARENRTSTCRKFPAPARAAASARKTFCSVGIRQRRRRCHSHCSCCGYGGRAAAPAPASRDAAGRGGAAHRALETAVPRERMYFGNYEVQPMSVMRQKIAEHMVVSKRVSPHVYSIDEADMTGIATLRAQVRKTNFEKDHRHQAHLHAFFRPRRRGRIAGISHGEFIRRRHQRRAAPGMQYRHRSGARLGLDRPGDQECRGEKFSGPGSGR